MKVGIVTTWFERGAAYVSRQYEDALQAGGHEVFIYARGGESYAKESEKWNRPNVTWGKKTLFQTTSTPVHKRDFLVWIQRYQLDVVLFNEQQWWPPVIWAKQTGVRVGAYIDYYKVQTVPLFDAYDFLICNTERHYSVFDWHENSVYIPWGTNTLMYTPKNDEGVDREGTPLIFFNSSGYSPDRKGVLPLIRAFANVVQRHHVKLILHTQVDLKAFYPKEGDLIDKLVSKGELEVISKTISAPGLYYLGDVYCYISKLDGIGLTVPEAISCGLPVVAPDQPPMNEFVKENQSGKLVSIKRLYCREDAYYWPQLEVNEQSLIEVLEFYAENKNLLRDFKVKAREFALSNLDWSDRYSAVQEVFGSSEVRPLSAHTLKQIKHYELKRFLHGFFSVPIRILRSLKR